MHKFSKADRAKAVATRKRNAEQRKLKEQQGVVATATTQLSVDSRVGFEEHKSARGETIPAVPLPPPNNKPTVFDWWDSPLPIVVERLNAIKREYDRAAQIVLQRQSQAPKAPLTCWVWENRARKWPGIPDVKGKPTEIEMPKTAIAQCKRTIADRSKAAFCDDGYREAGDPSGKIKSIFCCSMMCFLTYQQMRPVHGLSRH